MKFSIGPSLKCDLHSLIDTRALIQANSGGGKSWILRRLLEQTHGQVQQIVLDPEGEFASLREKFDYVLAAKHGGDTAADPRGAKLLAQRLLELKVSAIVDLYELKAHERIRFVRLFLEAMVDAPKALWHPVLLILDEAHVYCPEKGQAESAQAVIDEATRGRKRGHCLVLATQRLSKLHKDAAAELNNKLIGRTGLDVDVKRAAEELGFSGREQSYQLRDLDPGEFFGFGPALSRTVTKVKVGDIQTTHPKAGARIAFTAPPATAKIKALLPQLADLPAEAEARAKSEAELKKDLASARAEVTRLKNASPAAPNADPAELRDARRQGAQLEAHNERLTQALERLMKFILEINAQGFFEAGGEKIDQAALQKVIDAAAQQAVKLVESNVRAQGAALEKWRRQGERMLAEIGQLLKRDVKVSVAVRHNEPFTMRPAPRPPRREGPAPDQSGLATAQRKILNAMAFLDQVGISKPDKTQVALFAALSPTAGHTGNMLGGLRTAGLIEYPANGFVQLTEAGRALADPGTVPQTAEEMQGHLLGRVATAQRKLLEVLIAEYPNPMDKSACAERAGLSPTAGHTGNMFGGLRSMGIIDYPTPGTVVALPVLFLEGR